MDDIQEIRRKLNVGESGSIPELLDLEALLYKDLELKKFSRELGKYITKEIPNYQYATINDLKKIDDFVKNYYYKKLSTIELWITRAFVLGKLLEGYETSPQYKIISINAMPETIKDAIEKYHLTKNEINAINYSLSHGAEHLVSATNATITEVSRIVADGMAKRKTKRDIYRELEESFQKDEGEVNRNWKRVAIQEINTAFNEGYIAQFKPGTFLLGISMQDRCDNCGALIDGKVYPIVSAELIEDYSEMDKNSIEYKKQKFLWENAVWQTKNNVGRSSSKKKRMTNESGETEFVDREHFELSMPCIPLHIYCRCRWVRINPETQFVENGHMKMRISDPTAHTEWYNKNILPMLEKFSKFDIEL